MFFRYGRFCLWCYLLIWLRFRMRLCVNKVCDILWWMGFSLGNVVGSFWCCRGSLWHCLRRLHGECIIQIVFLKLIAKGFPVVIDTTKNRILGQDDCFWDYGYREVIGICLIKNLETCRLQSFVHCGNVSHVRLETGILVVGSEDARMLTVRWQFMYFWSFMQPGLQISTLKSQRAMEVQPLGIKGCDVRFDWIFCSGRRLGIFGWYPERWQLWFLLCLTWGMIVSKLFWSKTMYRQPL